METAFFFFPCNQVRKMNINDRIIDLRQKVKTSKATASEKRELSLLKAKRERDICQTNTRYVPETCRKPADKKTQREWLKKVVNDYAVKAEQERQRVKYHLSAAKGLKEKEQMIEIELTQNIISFVPKASEHITKLIRTGMINGPKQLMDSYMVFARSLGQVVSASVNQAYVIDAVMQIVKMSLVH